MNKKLKTIFDSKLRIYLFLCAAILILQLFPYLLIGESYGMLHHFIIALFLELLISWRKFYLVFCASVISSCSLALLVTGLLFCFRLWRKMLKFQHEKGSEKTEQ